MKLAYVLDVAGVESFYVKNGTAYSFKDDKPVEIIVGIFFEII